MPTTAAAQTQSGAVVVVGVQNSAQTSSRYQLLGRCARSGANDKHYPINMTQQYCVAFEHLSGFRACPSHVRIK